MRRDTAGGTPEPTLYDRVGGIFAISAVVNRFSDEIITNPKLNVNPALKAWNETEAEIRLPGLKFMRTLWVAALTGGPFTYTGLPLSEAHTRFTSPPTSSTRSGRRSCAPSSSTGCRRPRRTRSSRPTCSASPMWWQSPLSRPYSFPLHPHGNKSGGRRGLELKRAVLTHVAQAAGYT